jgi:Family of unknown function (DUF6025)
MCSQRDSRTSAAAFAERLLGAMGDSPGAKTLAAALARLHLGQRAFDWVHLGKSDLPIGRLIELLQTTPGMAPPRTGHLGDWSDIAAGRSGLLDYNKVICGDLAAGAALLIDTTSVETSTLDDGDRIYLPGSTVTRGRRRLLELFARTADGLSRLERNKTWFLPFTLTRVDGQVRLLSDLHRARNARLTLATDHVTARLLYDRARLEALLRMTLTAAATAPRRETMLRWLFASVVGTDADRRQATLGYHDDHSFALGGERLTLDELIARALLPALVMNDPATKEEHLRGRRAAVQVPVMSNLLVTLLLVLLGAHLDPRRPDLLRRAPVDVHLHWGAVGMAGFPPAKRGYFESGEYPRRLRPFFDAAVNGGHGVSPTLFVVAPAVIFSLLPRAGNPGEARLVRELFGRVLDSRARQGHQDRAASVERTVKDWLARVHPHLSAFYLRQFNGVRSLLAAAPPPKTAAPVVCEEFLALTCQEATMIVGALQEVSHAA